MANNYIAIDTTKRLGNRLRRCVDITREALSLLNEIRDIMDESNDGVDYGTIEAQFGLPTGKGLTAYNLVAGARSAVQAAATVNFVNRLG